MSSLKSYFPAACSRLRVFICYAREDRDLAVDIAQALTNAGHDVFIDANSLKVATDFNEAIREGIARADRFVFLASQHSLEPGAYPQTELGFAQRRWPSPKGVVWPVLVDRTIDPAALPAYLRAVQVHMPKGNIVADLSAEIEASRTVRASCLLSVAAAVLALVGVAAIAVEGLGTNTATLVMPQQVVLMPSERPDDKDAWMASPVALTLIPVNYSNDGNRDVRIVDETVGLPFGDGVLPFKWFNEVDIKPRCSPDWLCTKGPVGAGTLKAHGTLLRETMYLPAAGTNLPWKDFVTFACGSSADTLDVTLTSATRATSWVGASARTLRTTCRIDLKAMRQRLQEKGCKSSGAPLPLRLTPECQG